VSHTSQRDRPLDPDGADEYRRLRPLRCARQTPLEELALGLEPVVDVTAVTRALGQKQRVRTAGDFGRIDASRLALYQSRNRCRR
jgi:hypothetical protein